MPVLVVDDNATNRRRMLQHVLPPFLAVLDTCRPRRVAALLICLRRRRLFGRGLHHGRARVPAGYGHTYRLIASQITVLRREACKRALAYHVRFDANWELRWR